MHLVSYGRKKVERATMASHANQENLEASFIASASWPIRAIHRSTSSLFSRWSLLDFSSAILSCRLSVASSSWKSFQEKLISQVYSKDLIVEKKF